MKACWLRLLVCAQALALTLGCAWHTVHITTNTMQIPSHVQNGAVDITDDGAGTTLTEQDVTSTFTAPQLTGKTASGLDRGVGIYVHAGGRTLAVAGPVDMRVACRTFGKDSNITLIWGGMTYLCEGGELSDNGRGAIGDVVRQAVAGATGNPVGLGAQALEKYKAYKASKAAEAAAGAIPTPVPVR